jgi:aspartate/methionine/tyrosine aminotransferase
MTFCRRPWPLAGGAVGITDHDPQRSRCMPILNPLVVGIGSPPIPEAKAWGGSYNGAFGPLIDLSQAVPGYPPQAGLLRRLAEAAGDSNLCGYGPSLGDEALRAAYARHVSTLYQTSISATETAITGGCNQAFFASMIALARAGDAIILPSPWYFNHQMTLAMLGVEARALHCRAQAGFVPDAKDAEALIDDRVKAIVLVTPNNPTGAVYPAETIEAFRGLCQARGLTLVIDETYRDFLVGEPAAPHRLFDQADWPSVVVQLYSFSKSYCIPGHRVGAVVAGTDFLEELAKVLDNVQICPPRVGQTALTWALEALAEWRAHNRQEIGRRADALRQTLATSPTWSIDSIGAYFAYIRHPFADYSAAEIAARLAADRGVLGLPGSYFGAGQERHLRIAFANVSADQLTTLGSRLTGFDI